MIAMVSVALLVLGFLLAIISVFLLPRGTAEIDRRLLESGTTTDVVRGIGRGPRVGGSLLGRFLAFAATLAPGALKGQELRDQLAGAGVYSAEAVRLFIGSKVLLAGLVGSATYLALFLFHRPETERAILALIGGFLGFQMPAIWLWSATDRRRTAIRLGLPDALDLMVVCVEAGLGLNAALVRVGRETHRTCRPLAQELLLVNQEIRAGTARSVALRNLGRRVLLPDVQALAAMLIQTDRLGTSIARSLRVHADSLRTRRRQRAEEQARKTSIKLIFPLLLIFLELLVILLGPAGIQLYKALKDSSGP
jgi:tight adherence protein C